MDEASDTLRAHEYAQALESRPVAGNPRAFVRPTCRAADKEYSAVTKGDQN